MHKSLKDIFSLDINRKYTDFCKEYNRELVNRLLNEKDVEKRIIFEKIFNLNFMECMDHFTEKKKINELDGLKTLDDIFQNFESNYYKSIKHYALNYEDNVGRRKSRSRAKMM